MGKNFIIGILIVIIICMGDYILFQKRIDQAPTVPSMQIATTAPAQAAPVNTNAKSAVVFVHTTGANNPETLSTVDLTSNAVTDIANGFTLNPLIGETTAFIFEKVGTWNDTTKTWNGPKKSDDLMQYTSTDKILHEVKDLIATPDAIGRSAVLSADGEKMFHLTSSSTDCKTPQTLGLLELSSGADTQIASFATNPFGTAVKNSCEDATLVGLSSDETKLYMTAGSTVQAGTQDPGLYVYDLSTNNFLPKLNASETMIGAKLSPDGKKIAYVPYASTTNATGWLPVKPYTVDILDLSSGIVSPVLTNNTNPYTGVWWSADGSELLYGMDSLKKSSELSELATYDVLDISSGQSSDVPLDYTNTNTNRILSYDGSLLVFEDTVENSPATNADNDHQLKLYDFGNASTKLLTSYTGVGGYPSATLFK